MSCKDVSQSPYEVHSCATEVDSIVGTDLYKNKALLSTTLPFHFYNHKYSYLSELKDSRWAGGRVNEKLVYIAPTSDKVNYNGERKNIYMVTFSDHRNIRRRYRILFDTLILPPYISNI